MSVEFEWHYGKAGTNMKAHGASFELAKTVNSLNCRD